jgi:hypothetical protein
MPAIEVFWYLMLFWVSILFIGVDIDLLRRPKEIPLCWSLDLAKWVEMDLLHPWGLTIISFIIGFAWVFNYLYAKTFIPHTRFIVRIKIFINFILLGSGWYPQIFLIFTCIFHDIPLVMGNVILCYWLAIATIVMPINLLFFSIYITGMESKYPKLMGAKKDFYAITGSIWVHLFLLIFLPGYKFIFIW